MRNKFNKYFFCLLLLGCVGLLPYSNTNAQSILPSFGKSRSGTSGFQFVKITVDPRAAAMGNSVVADAKDGSSLYWNPALAVQSDQSEVLFSHSIYFMDITKEYVSYVQQLKSIAVGVSLQYLNSGDIKETTEFQPLGTGLTFRTIHYSLGLTVSQKLTELFSYGLTVHFLDERIEEIQTKTGSVDLGFFYRVGDTGLRFAIGLNNFGPDAKPTGDTQRITLDGNQTEKNFQKVSLPTTFIIGAAYDAYKSEHSSLMISGQLTNPSDNAERVSVGVEYGFMHRFYLRGGYQFGVDEVKYPSGGIGVVVPAGKHSFNFDYSFSPYERLGNIHRLALKISI